MSREWEQAGGRHDWRWEAGQEAETAIQASGLGSGRGIKGSVWIQEPCGR